MVEIEKPRITCLDNPEDASYGKYVVEPLERGYGMTLGNSLRRTVNFTPTVGGGFAMPATFLSLTAKQVSLYALATSSGTQTTKWSVHITGTWK